MIMKRSACRQTARFLAIFGIALALLICCRQPAFAEDPARRSILIIYPFERVIPYNVKFLSGLTRALESFDLNMFEICQENLNLDRIDSGEYLDALAAAYAIKYASKHFDAIVTVNDWAFDFLLSRGSSLSPGTPVVRVGTSGDKLPAEIAGRKIFPISDRVDLKGNIELILRMQPTLTRLYVISGVHPYERLFWVHMRQILSQFRDGPEFVFLGDTSYNELLGFVAGLNPSDAILFLSFLRDESGRDFTPQFVAGKLSQSAGCPVYGIADTYMDSGIVGGVMVSIFESGLSAGNVLVDLFTAGESVNDVPRKMWTPLLRQVDEQQMARWHLSERNLPAGFEVLNRSPSLWRDYKKHVGIALLFFFAQGTLIFWLFIQWRSKRAAEQELRGTCRELEENQEELSRARDLQDRTLESLTESEATLQALLSSIPVGVVMIDAGSGTVLKANRAAAELLNIPLQEMAGSPCPDCFRSFISDGAGQISQDSASSFEDTLQGKQGSLIHILKTVDRVFLHGTTHLIGCLLDITQRKTAEREARARTEQLVHADKMISLGIMAAGITHEIHNPNNSISLNADILKSAWEVVLEKLDEHPEETEDFLIERLPWSRAKKRIPALLNGIIEGSERIKSIVRDMREFVSPSGAIEEVDINAVLRSSLNLLASKLNKSTDNLIVEYGEKMPRVEANAQRLGQVAINLILNGAEALTDKAQSLIIRTRYVNEGSKIILEVRDSGPGIAPENLKRIFDPFFTTKRETGGTGLGLAISQKIVDAYGGRILISSAVGEGTTASMELPVSSGSE